ncbi:alpha-amylase family glycosyl hydrolase [Ancylomarina sp. YFZ004]
MKKLYKYILLFLLLIPTIGFGQITTVPEFPNVNSEITITFDSSKESGLGTFSGDLYAHTGVFIEGSTDWQHVIGTWGDNSSQPQLTNKGNGIYELVITPNITDYYSVANGEIVTDITLVFRSADGNSQTNDLSIEVFNEGLNVSFASPSDDSMIIKNESLQVEVKATANDKLTLFLDGIQQETTTTNQISTSIQTAVAGTHELVAIATAGSEEARDTIHFFVREDVVTEQMPAGIIPGINYIDDNTVTLALYAPNKEYIYVIGDVTNWEINNTYQMKKDSDHFWITIDNLTAGEEYIYQYIIDGNIKIADPYADKLSDPWNDKYILDATYPNLIKYPDGKTTEIASVFQTGQSDFTWTDSGFAVPDEKDLVVYELHVRDFVATGNIKTVKDTLDYLERLGINAIELMPFNEFEGNDSWGYNPSFYFAPDKAYGTKEDYKAFIDECHKRGIAVLMDMVLNHSFGQSPFLRMYFDGTKPTADSPWYNVENNFENTDAHWGYDFNHTSQATKDLVDRINSYWMTEYHIDGFRFDFTKGFSNTPHSNSTDPWGSQYDQQRIDLLKRMSTEIWNVKSDAVVIFEHLSENSEEKELAAHGILLWGNANHDYSEATKGESSNFSWTSWKNRDWDGPKVVSYMESHDEERMMYRNLTEGTSLDGYNVRSLNTALSRIETAAAFFFTVPGPKMVWQFGELGYDVSIEENGRVGKKPIHWEYQDDPNRKRVYQIFAALAKIKKEEAAFESDDFTLNTSQPLKQIEINHADMDVRIIGNFDVKTGSISPQFSKTGTWYDYFSSTEINVTNVDANIQLAPGEYHIYTTKQLTKPNVISAPMASAVLITGTAKENETLTASYSYSDTNGDAEGTSIYKWYRADDVDGTNKMGITGATNITYTAGADDRHKFIGFSVTPVAQTGELLSGNTIYSDYSDKIVSLVNPPVASNLAINGEFIQDAVLTATYTYTDSEGDSEGKSIIQWYLADNQSGTNEAAIQGANTLEYTITRQDVGRYLRFAVTPVAISDELTSGEEVYSAYSEAIDYSTGIEDVLDEELSLYPNPVKDLLHLDNLKQVKRLSLYSLTGKIILYKHNPDSNEILDLRHLNQGIYIIVFDLDDGNQLTRKIIKQ